MKVLQSVVPILGLVLLVVGCDTDPVLDALLDNIEETPVTEKVTPPLNREAILAWPAEDAPEEEKRRHWDLVVAAAVNVNILDITDCTPNPLVIEVGHGESIEVRNGDTTDHTLHRGEASITIPVGGSRGMVVSEFARVAEGVFGIANYACDNASVGVFYINPRLPVKPSEKQRYITFKVVEFLFPDGSSGPSLEGVRVTALKGSAEGKKETATDGSVTLRGDLPLTIQLEKEGYITTRVTVLEEGEAIVFPGLQRHITFRVVEPLFPNEGGPFDWPDYRNGPGIEGVRVTVLKGSAERKKETDADGSVSFFGTPPLTIRIEKPGYITTESIVGRGSEVVFPNEWPKEVEEAIRQLGLEERIASGWLTLRWGDEEFLQARYGDDVGGLCPCPNIIVRKYEDRDFMVWILVHELMHVWQNLNSNKPPCGNLHVDWSLSEEGQAWIAAMEKDLQEIGPMPDFDDREWTKPLVENHAGFYSYWYMGPETDVLNEKWDRPAELKKLYRFAPNRCKYMEDRFGPPPPR